MTSYKINFRIVDAKTSDYEKLFKELKSALIAKLRTLKMPSAYDLVRGAEYSYFGGGSLQEVTAASYHVARSIGKEYSFTIIKQKGPTKVTIFENELIH